MSGTVTKRAVRSKKKSNPKKGVRKAKSSNRASKGGSSSFFRAAAKLAPIAGAALGNYIAPGVGGAIGSAAGGLLASIAGHGSYTIKRNTIFFPDQVPLFRTNQDGAIRMQHREFITDIVTNSVAGKFQVQTFPIDVANPTSFPFLSQIACNFEEWRMEGLIFEYKTTSGSISSTGQLGTAILATQYNSNAVPFTNKQSMEAYTFASSTVVSASVIHPIECDPMQTPSNGLFYTNCPGTSVGVSDKRWQQMGNFSIATQGCAQSENIGELWVSYDVWLCKPRLISNTSSLADHWRLTSPTTVGPVYFGTDPQITDGSDDFTQLGGSTIYFKSSFNGNVAISYYVAGSTGAWVAPIISTGVGASQLNLLDGQYNQLTTTTVNTADSVMVTAYFTLESQPSGSGLPNGYGSSVTFATATFFSATNGDLIITQLPSDFS